MEEILASIRKIISEDASEKPAPQAATHAADSLAPTAATVTGPPAGDTDVLELTQVVTEEEPQESSPLPLEDDIGFATVHEPKSTEPAPETDHEPALEAEAEDELEPEPELEPAPELAAIEPEPHSAVSDESIFSEKSSKALDEALANLDQAIEQAPKAELPDSLSSNNEQALGAIILNALRDKIDPVVGQWLNDNRVALVKHMKPIIREWLDENFPAMLTQAVRSEVARVVKSRGAKH